jgi:hypothetical protein
LRLADRAAIQATDNLDTFEAMLGCAIAKTQCREQSNATSALPARVLDSGCLRELGRLVLGADVRREGMEPGSMKSQVAKAEELGNLIARSPGMTPARAMQVLRLSNMSPNPETAAVVLDKLTSRTASDHACLAGPTSELGKLVPQDYASNGVTTWTDGPGASAAQIAREYFL